MPFSQNTSPTLVKQPQNGKVNIVNADGQTQKTVYTAGANGSKLTSLVGTSTDTSARDIQISITNGGTSYLLGTVSLPIGAGTTSAIPSVNMLDPTKLVGLAYDSDNNPYIHLVSGDTLTVSAPVSITAAKTVTVHAPSVGDF
jgi:hypothetical protein